MDTTFLPFSVSLLGTTGSDKHLLISYTFTEHLLSVGIVLNAKRYGDEPKEMILSVFRGNFL